MKEPRNYHFTGMVSGRVRVLPMGQWDMGSYPDPVKDDIRHCCPVCASSVTAVAEDYEAKLSGAISRYVFCRTMRLDGGLVATTDDTSAAQYAIFNLASSLAAQVWLPLTAAIDDYVKAIDEGKTAEIFEAERELGNRIADAVKYRGVRGRVSR